MSENTKTADTEMRKALEKAAIEWDKESPDDQFASEVFDDGFKRAWEHQQSRIAQLEAELAEARKDQARYQTMRKAIVNCDRKVEEILLQNLTDAGGNDEFDAAVDLAIKEQGK